MAGHPPGAELEAQIAGSSDEPSRAALRRDLRNWQTRQITAQVAPAPAGDSVEFAVRVAVLLNGKPKTFEIAGDDELDPSDGLISFITPVTRAMLGTDVGETLPFGNRPDAIRILEIIPGDANGDAPPGAPSERSQVSTK